MGKRKNKSKNKKKEEKVEVEDDVFVLPEPTAPPEWVQAGAEGRAEAETLEHVFLEGAVVCKTGARHKANCEGNAFCLQGIHGAQSQPPVFDVGFDPLDRATDACPAGAAAFAELVAKHDADGILRRVRDPATTPAGLRNLDNTCYMNAFLQSLYAVAPFRELLYRWEPSTSAAASASAANQDIVGALQSLFARMDASGYAAADPADLVKALELDPHVQQDPQEFEQLFLSLVQEQLDAAGLGADMRALFGGAAAYTTVCSVCGTTMPSPHNFSDIALPIGRTAGTLEAALSAYTAEERLTGANQYRCGTCDRLVDATRRLTLQTLPPVLTVQLMRFQYDVKTANKKKRRDAFKFPRTIDLRPFVTPAPAPAPKEGKGEATEEASAGATEGSDKSLVYELFVVLLHRGDTANSGHYVCYASPDGDAAGRWFEYDDSTVSDVTELVGELFGADGARVAANSHNRLQAPWAHDAYALVYRRADRTVARPVVPSDLVERAVAAHEADVMRFVDALCSERRRAADLIKARASLIGTVTQNSKTVSEIPRADLRFVATDWLVRFITREDCGPVDNTPLVCPHGQLSPVCHARAKCVHRDVWARLATQFGGGPELSLAHACRECLAAHCKELAARIVEQERRAAVVRQVEKERKAQKRMEPAQCYWISRAWVEQWLRAPAADAVDYTCMTAPITCEHGALAPDESARMLVSAAVWSYLASHAPLGTTLHEFGGTAGPCPRCVEEHAAFEAKTKSLREAKQKEQSQFKALLHSSHQTKVGKYHLVDVKWFVAWKQWLDNAKDLATSVPRFNNAPLLCPHGKLAYNPCEYISENEQKPCPFAAVPDALWPALKAQHGEPDTPDIELTLVVHQEPELSCGTCWECLFSDDGGGSCENVDSPDSGLSFASGTLTLRRLPGRFSSADEVVKAAPACTDSPNANAPEDTKGKPRRSARLAEKQKAKTVTQTIQGVDSSWTVQGLKMHIFANYDHVLDCGMPDEQVLVLDGTVLDDEHTLEAYSLRDGVSTLTLGILSPSIGQAGSKPSSPSDVEPQRPLETGFAGSRLLRASGPFVPPPSSSS